MAKKKECDICGKVPETKMIYLSGDHQICENCWKTRTHGTIISNSVSGWNFEDLMHDITKRIVKDHLENLSYFQTQVRNNLEMFLNALPNGIIASDGSYKGFIANHGAYHGVIQNQETPKTPSAAELEKVWNEFSLIVNNLTLERIGCFSSSEISLFKFLSSEVTLSKGLLFQLKQEKARIWNRLYQEAEFMRSGR